METATRTLAELGRTLSPRQARRAARWERRLLRMTRLSRTATIHNMLSFARFTKHEDGTVTENGWTFDTAISAQAWSTYLAERRHPDARHAYEGDSRPIFTDKGDRSWPQRTITCTHCGDSRVVSFFLDPTTVRVGWCTA